MPGDIAAAREEMDCRTVQSQFSDNEFDTSIPCQLRFTSPPEQDIDRFHDALETRDYADLDVDPARGYEDRAYYDGEVCNKEHYNRIRVNVSGRTVRLYPRDEYVPDHDELARLICAIQAGFDADLEHDPIDQEGNDGD